jgi:threonylcarbamoyladenosine tRNA methylthiotransferase MtaB
MLQKGVREIVLTGVNLGTYLSEGKDFLNLIEGLSALRGLDRLRVSSIEPTTIPTELFGWMADPSHPLMPYLHIPMQAGSDKILKLMRRRYSLEEMKRFFQEAMNQVPDLCLGTDLMVGFPNETSDDFEQTCSTFMEFPFSYCHVFTYSERQGTAANRMDQIPMQERRARSAHLRRLSASKRMSFHEGQMGREFRVLLENPKDDLQSGYTDHYLKVILKEKGSAMANKMAMVKITEALPEYVMGDLIEVES